MRWCGLPLLALGELRLLAGLLQTVLLALDHTGVATQVAGALQLGTVLVASLQQCTSNTVTQRTGLAGRAAAVALEQEMSARTQEMRARVVEAEAQVPLAIAEAFRNGQLGVMDYAKYKNVLADTEMRTKIAGDTPGTK